MRVRLSEPTSNSPNPFGPAEPAVSSDLILVMQHGDIVEQGNHEELLARKGFYYELYMSQFKKQEEEILDLRQAVPAD